MTDDAAGAGRSPRLGITFDEAARHIENLGFLDVNGRHRAAPT
jgi:hypothetical protein